MGNSVRGQGQGQGQAQGQARQHARPVQRYCLLRRLNHPFSRRSDAARYTYFIVKAQLSLLCGHYVSLSCHHRTPYSIIRGPGFGRVFFCAFCNSKTYGLVIFCSWKRQMAPPISYIYIRFSDIPFELAAALCSRLFSFNGRGGDECKDAVYHIGLKPRHDTAIA